MTLHKVSAVEVWCRDYLAGRWSLFIACWVSPLPFETWSKDTEWEGSQPLLPTGTIFWRSFELNGAPSGPVFATSGLSDRVGVLKITPVLHSSNHVY